MNRASLRLVCSLSGWDYGALKYEGASRAALQPEQSAMVNRPALPFVLIEMWFSTDGRRILPRHNRWLCSIKWLGQRDLTANCPLVALRIR